MTEEKRTARAQRTQGFGEEGADSLESRFQDPPPHVNDLARRTLEAAVEVHRHLGPGYAESVYENAFAIELGLRGIPFMKQTGFRVDYKGHEVGEGRMDLLIDRALIVELKAVDRFTEVHVSQVLAYLKATGHALALLINFNVPVLMRGVKRVVLNRPITYEEALAMASAPRGSQT